MMHYNNNGHWKSIRLTENKTLLFYSIPFHSAFVRENWGSNKTTTAIKLVEIEKKISVAFCVFVFSSSFFLF